MGTVPHLSARQRTAEQQAARVQLQALARPFRFRVLDDAERWPILPGQLGQVEHHDGRELAVYTDRPRLFGKLWAIPGMRRHQTGDREMRALFPPEALEPVAGVVRLRRRAIRPMTPERLVQLADGRRQKVPEAPMSEASRPVERIRPRKPGEEADAA